MTAGGARWFDVAERLAARGRRFLAVLLAGAAVLVGLDVHADAVRRADVEVAERVRVGAELLAPGAPEVEIEAGAVASPPRRAPARWTAPDGTARTGELVVWASAGSGTIVPVWTDGDGDLVPPPADRGSAPVAGVLAALLVLVLGGGLLGGLRVLVRAVALAAAARFWGREWERVGPEWTGRPA